MISDRGIDALRLAATLAHALPLYVRLRHDTRVLVEVARAPHEPAPGARWLSPCGFRVATAGAWRLHRGGRPVAMRGLPDGVDPTVDIGVPSGGRVRPGGIYQLPTDHATLYVFATTASSSRCRVAAEPFGVGVHADDVTGVALVHATAEGAADELDMVETLEGLLATLTAEALLRDLAGSHRR